MGNKVTIPVVVLTAEVLPVKLKIKVEQPKKPNAKAVTSEVLMKPVSITTVDRKDAVVLQTDPESKYTFSIKIKVGKYIKQLHWLLVICKDNTREQPAPVEGKMPWSAFGEDVTQLKTDFPMNTLKKGVLRYTFEPLIVGDGYARGSTQTLWIYTYDQNDVVHHLHQTVRMIGQADSAGGSRLPVSTLSRVSSRVSTNSTTESLHSTTSEDSQPPPPAYAEPDGHAVSNDSMQDARGRSKGIKKKNSTASKILKPRMTDDVVSTPDEVIKKKTLATVEVYLLGIILLQFIVIVTLARLVYTQSLRIAYLEPEGWEPNA